MADETLQSILDQQVNEVKVPPPLPAGQYLCVVRGQPEFREVGQDKTNVVDFNLEILQPGPDISQSDLAAFDGGVAGKNIRARFFLTDRAVFMLDRFLFEHLGIDLGKPRKQAIGEAMGHQVYATIRHTPRDDGAGFYANLSATAKV